MFKKIIFSLFAILLFGIVSSIWLLNRRVPVVPISITPPSAVPRPVPTPTPSPRPTPPAPTPLPNPLTNVRLSPTPFMAQAPNGEWNDPLFQDACEEASLLLARHYLTGETLTAATAKAEITELAATATRLFGHAIDTSAEDTLKLWQEHYQTDTGRVVADITADDIKRALYQGSIVIVPTDGRLLGNRHFTPPGPPRHMLTIIGYTPATEEFIANDPGTRQGAGYRYAEDVLYSAILDYPTGAVHGPVTSKRKVMIVIDKPAAEPVDAQAEVR